MYYNPQKPAENLFLNAVPFKYPADEQVLYFSDKDKEGVSLYRLHGDKPIPPVVRAVFPDLKADQPLYTSYDRKVEGMTPIAVNFNDPANYYLVKRYYNHRILMYFRSKEVLADETFIHDTQVWIGNRERQQKSPEFLACFDRFTLRIGYNAPHKTPILIVSYDRPARILKKSVQQLIDEFKAANTDPFEQPETNPVDIINKVLVTTYTKGEHRRKKFHITKYAKLMEGGEDGKPVEMKHVHPIMNADLEKYLNINDEDDNPNPRAESRYKKHCEKINGFISRALNVEGFRKIIPFENSYLSVTAGRVNAASKELIFGNGTVDFVPRKGVNVGPFRGPGSSNIKLLFIGHKDHIETAKTLLRCFMNGYGYYTGLRTYLGCDFTFQKGISFNSDHPFEEIRQKFEQMLPTLDRTASYIGIYMTPVSKNIRDYDKLQDYYSVKELFLKYGIPVQSIETDKMIANLTDDDANKRKNFGYTLQNMSIAINAKLGGTPWKLNVPDQRELVIGVGAFRNRRNGAKYIGSAFSFDNSGTFNSFQYFLKDEIDELAGAIKMSIVQYSAAIQNPDRLIIHFYKDMNEKEVEKIEECLRSLGLQIPIYIVTINKTESEDVFVFDSSVGHKMPYSGRYVNLGNSKFLLCNNTRYENYQGRIESCPFVSGRSDSSLATG